MMNGFEGHLKNIFNVCCGHENDKENVISRRCYDFLDLLLQEWQTHSLER